MFTISDQQGDTPASDRTRIIDAGPTRVTVLKAELGVPKDSWLWVISRDGRKKPLADHATYEVRAGDHFEAVVRLASLVGYTPSYVSKVERGTILASREFAEAADQHLRAGRAIIRRWRDTHEVLAAVPGDRAARRDGGGDPLPPPGPEVVVEHEIAELVCRVAVYTTSVGRRLRITGVQPVTA